MKYIVLALILVMPCMTYCMEALLQQTKNVGVQAAQKSLLKEILRNQAGATDQEKKQALATSFCTKKPDAALQKSIRLMLEANDGNHLSENFLRDSFDTAIEGVPLNPYTIILKINVQDKVFGMTALMWATIFDAIPFVKQLSGKYFNADATVVDNFGNTALHYAVMRGNPVMITLLLQFSQTPMIKKNKNGQNPVDLAELLGKNCDVLEALGGKIFEEPKK